LTDIARYKSDEAKDVIKNWMRSKDTIEFLGLWEKLHNNNFKGVEFDSFRNQSGKGDKRIFQTLKEKSLDLPKEESLGIFSNIYLFLVLLSMTGRIQ
jgi:hypothetical protein